MRCREQTLFSDSNRSGAPRAAVAPQVAVSAEPRARGGQRRGEDQPWGQRAQLQRTGRWLQASCLFISTCKMGGGAISTPLQPRGT